MASLADFYQGGLQSPQFAIAELNAQGTDASTNAGVTTARMQRQYETRTLPQLVNREASKGSFYSGNAGVRADQAKEDYLNASGDVTRQLNQTLSQLARQRLYAQLGVTV